MSLPIEGISPVSRPVKPRSTGITMVLDKISTPNECLILEDIADYVDYVKIGWGLSTIMKRERLSQRIKLYHDYDIDVGIGGTVLEMFELRGKLEKLLREAWNLGIDVIEVSAGIVDISLERRLEIAELSAKMGFKVTFEVGKKNPMKRLTQPVVLEEISRAISSEHVWKVVIEGREFGVSSCIYDGEGDIKEDWLAAITSVAPPEDLIFEAPLVKQQIELIKRIGPNVNLGNVKMEDVLSLESLRRGLRGDTFLMRNVHAITGSPSEKFVYYVLKHFGPMTLSDIREKTGLPPRTIYKALKSLRERGLVDKQEFNKRPIWFIT